MHIGASPEIDIVLLLDTSDVCVVSLLPQTPILISTAITFHAGRIHDRLNLPSALASARNPDRLRLGERLRRRSSLHQLTGTSVRPA